MCVHEGANKKHPAALVERAGVQEEKAWLSKMLFRVNLKAHLIKITSVKLLTSLQ